MSVVFGVQASSEVRQVHLSGLRLQERNMSLLPHEREHSQSHLRR